MNITIDSGMYLGRLLIEFSSEMEKLCNNLMAHLNDVRDIKKHDVGFDDIAINETEESINIIISALPVIKDFGEYQIKLVNRILEFEALSFENKLEKHQRIIGDVNENIRCQEVEKTNVYKKILESLNPKNKE